MGFYDDANGRMTRLTQIANSQQAALEAAQAQQQQMAARGPNPYGYYAPNPGLQGTTAATGFRAGGDGIQRNDADVYAADLRNNAGAGAGFGFTEAGYNTADLAAQYAGDPRAFEIAASQRKILQSGGWTPDADASRYVLGGNANWAPDRIAMYDQLAQQQLGPSRYQAGIDLAGAYQAAAAGRVAGVGDQFGGVGQNIGNAAGQFGGLANQAGATANGAGYQGQLGAADALYALGQQQQGPSAAEMAMRQQSGQALQQQAGLAAAARGANAGLGMQIAAQQGAATQAGLIGQLGQQRANEDLAYRQQRAQALGAAGGLYGQAMGSQLQAYNQQGNLLGQQVGAYGQQAGVLGQQAGVYGNAGQLGGQTAQIAAIGAGVEQQRQQAAQQYYGMGSQLASTQLGADMGYDQNRTQNYLQRFGIMAGGNNARDARDDAFGKQLLGAGLTLGGAVAGTFVGGPAGTVGGAALGSAAASSLK